MSGAASGRFRLFTNVFVSAVLACGVAYLAYRYNFLPFGGTSGTKVIKKACETEDEFEARFEANRRMLNQKGVEVGDVDTDEDDEDEEDDDDDEEGSAKKKEKKEETEEEKAARLKFEAKLERFNVCTSTGFKRFQGQQYPQAIELYSEALDLAEQVNKRSEMLSCYNNRSALYEKTNRFEESLADITTVLALDKENVPSRLRRGKIFEAQGKLREALQEYAVAMHVETKKHTRPEHVKSKPEKLEEVAKKIAIQNASSFATQNATRKVHDMPSKSVCRQLFDTLPSSYRWKVEYASADRSSLDEALKTASPEDSLKAVLDVVCASISDGAFSKAFRVLATASPSTSTNASPAMFALLRHLQGVEFYLRCNLQAAKQLFAEAMHLNYTSSFDSALMLATTEMDLGNLSDSLNIYFRLFTDFLPFAEAPESAEKEALTGFLADTASSTISTISLPDLTRAFGEEKLRVEAARFAWALIHRSSLWTIRDEHGAYRNNSSALAMQDLNAALAVLDVFGPSPSEPIAKVALMSVLIKVIQTKHASYAHTPAATVEEQEFDRNLCRENLSRAKTLFPNSVQVMVTDADLHTIEERFEEALVIIEKLSANTDNDDTLPHILMANTKVQSAYHMFHDPMRGSQVQAIFGEAISHYEDAVRKRETCPDALSYFAQFKLMLGDTEGAFEMYTKAIELVRSRDEVMDVSKYLELAEAQIYVTKHF